MSYVTLNIVWFLLQPSSLMWLALVAGLLLLWSQRTMRLGKRLAVFGAASLMVAGLSPLGTLLILPLEQHFAAGDPTRAGRIDGIIVLGGGEDGRVSTGRGQLALNEAGERIALAVALARRLPEARLIFTGGAGAIVREAIPGGESVVQFWRDTGIDAGRIVLEGKSVTTYENAQFTRSLVEPRPGQRWLLVTSAAHMPRSVGLFRRAGFDVVPHSVDFRTKDASDVWRTFNAIPRGLQRVDDACREWASLLAHRLTGRIDSIFPVP
jgi:uncharacterized SAM-binding protein YcdF (DUF218 family)